MMTKLFRLLSMVALAAMPMRGLEYVLVDDVVDSNGQLPYFDGTNFKVLDPPGSVGQLRIAADGTLSWVALGSLGASQLDAPDGTPTGVVSVDNAGLVSVTGVSTFSGQPTSFSADKASLVVNPGVIDSRGFLFSAYNNSLPMFTVKANGAISVAGTASVTGLLTLDPAGAFGAGTGLAYGGGSYIRESAAGVVDYSATTHAFAGDMTVSGQATIPTILTQLNRVYCMGDSLSNGTWEPTLETLLGSLWQVNEFGVQGNTTAQMVSRFDADVVVPDASYVVVLAGINSVKSDVSAADIKADLQTMYTAAADNGSTVVAVKMTPFKGYATWTSDWQDVLDEVNAWITSTAADVDYIVDAYTALEDPANPDTLLPAYDGGDHLHLNATGYAFLGGVIHDGVTWTATSPHNITVSVADVTLCQPLGYDDTVRFGAVQAAGESYIMGSLGLGTSTPGVLTAGGVILPARTKLHVLNPDNTAYVIIEGGSGASLYLVDAGGDTDTSIAQLESDDGTLVIRSLSDGLTSRGIMMSFDLATRIVSHTTATLFDSTVGVTGLLTLDSAQTFGVTTGLAWGDGGSTIHETSDGVLAYGATTHALTGNVDVTGDLTTTGRVGIGTAVSSSSYVYTLSPSINPAGVPQRGNYTILRLAATALDSPDHSSVAGEIRATGAQDYTGNVVGTLGDMVHYGTGTLTRASGVHGQVRISNSATGTITAANALKTSIDAEDGTITNARGLYVPAHTKDTGTLTNAYGIYLDEQTAGSSLNYQIYSVGGEIYHGGNATIGGTLGVTGETTLNDTLNLAGDARVYKNEWINLGGLKAPGTSPATYIDLGISGAWEFTDGTDDTMVATIRLPKGMDITVAPVINLGWSSATADPGDDSKQVVWQVEYLYRTAGESLAAAADATLEVTTSASTTANGLVVSEITLATPGATDQLLLLRIKRLGADGDDDLGDDARLSGCGMKYAINKLGVPL